MTKWDSMNIDAPHTQRELDEIPQGAASGPDAAKIALMKEMNWKPASQYWREKAEAANQRIEELDRELAAEKALADQLYDGTDNIADRTAYRKARGL